MPLEGIPVLENTQATQTIIQQIAGDVSNKQDHSANLDAWSLLATSSKQDAVISRVAHEDVPAFRAITSTGYLADSTNIAHLSKFIGVSLAHILISTSGDVALGGIVTNPAWTFNIGDRIFLGGAGVLQNTVPIGAVFVLKLGQAITTTSIELKPEINILL